MNVKALKKQLKEMGLPTDGKKSDLEFRLAGALKYDETCEACGEEPCACVDEDAIEDEVIEEVAEEEIAEELAEEEEVVEEVAPEKGPCECEWCANGYTHRDVTIEKRPDTPSREWDIAKYGKKPDGAYVRPDGAHLLVDGKKIEE